MRYALPLFVLMLTASGCSGWDCGPFDSFQTIEKNTEVTAAAPASDTLVVVFNRSPLWGDSNQGIYVRLGAETPSSSNAPELQLFLGATYSDYSIDDLPDFYTETSRDTLFVEPRRRTLAEAPLCQPREGIAQPVCSPPAASLRVEIHGTRAPKGVRHIRFAARGPYGTLHSLAPSASPPAETASRPGPRRSVRT